MTEYAINAASKTWRNSATSSGSGGSHDGVKVTRNDPFLGSPVNCPDGSTTTIPLPKPVNGIDSAFYSDGTGATIPVGKAGQYQCSATIGLADYFTAGTHVSMDIYHTTIEPVESPDIIALPLPEIDGTSDIPKFYSVSGFLDLAEGEIVRLRVHCEGDDVDVLYASLALFKIPIGSTPVCAEPIAMNLPGADVDADSNGNDVSGPLDLAAGDRVTVNINVTSSDYTGGFVGIFSPSLASYGTTGYVTLTGSAFSGSFLVDADAADWYVFVQSPGISYDPDLDGDPMTYCVIPAS